MVQKDSCCNSSKLLILHSDDNVGIITNTVQLGEEVVTQKDNQVLSVTLREKIPVGHKVAINDIPKGEYVLKYGMPIGRASKDIISGVWVHDHNVFDIAEEVINNLQKDSSKNK